MRKNLIRIISLFLVFSICFGIFTVSASASEPVTLTPLIVDKFDSRGNGLSQLYDITDDRVGFDGLVTYDNLCIISDSFNTLDWLFVGYNSYRQGSSVIKYVAAMSAYVIYDKVSGSYLCTPSGQLIFYYTDFVDPNVSSPSSLSPLVESVLASNTHNSEQFLDFVIANKFGSVSMSDLVKAQNWWNTHYWLPSGGSTLVNGAAEIAYIPSLKAYVLYDIRLHAYIANSYGLLAYYSPSGDSGTATGNSYNYYSSGDTVTNNDNSVTTNNYNSGDTINGNVLNLQDGTYYDYTGSTVTTYDIQSLVYNPTTNNYYVTVYDTTNNYNYEITYNYQYTYVSYTYLGSTGEYQKDEYKYYYELPDGRSSEDLTADEIAGLSLDFDVVNYAREHTDTHTRMLYHFDGSIEDDSYYQDVTSWNYTAGASYSFVDSSLFNGALFFNQYSSGLNFDGASVASDDDFTVSWRMYNGTSNNVGSGRNQIFFHEPGTNCAIGVQFNSYYIYLSYLDVGGWHEMTAVPLPTGIWYEVAIVRLNGTLTLYLNGVPVRFTSHASVNIPFDRLFFGLTNVFHSHYYLDELRVVDFAVYDTNYVPSPVPFDTNNVFVLPDTTNFDDLTIAVQSMLSISGYRVGGVRPTFPEVGMVWFPVESRRITDCQIYNGHAWESVGCRLWTGERWIPLWAFDIITLADLYDIADGDESYTEPITTESGFWSWFQNAWADFKNWYTGFDGGSADVDIEQYVDEESGFSLLGTLGDLVGSMVDLASSLVSTVFDGLFSGAAAAISGFTDSFGSSGSVLDFATYEGVDIWD